MITPVQKNNNTCVHNFNQPCIIPYCLHIQTLANLTTIGIIDKNLVRAKPRICAYMQLLLYGYKILWG